MPNTGSILVALGLMEEPERSKRKALCVRCRGAEAAENSKYCSNCIKAIEHNKQRLREDRDTDEKCS